MKEYTSEKIFISVEREMESCIKKEEESRNKKEQDYKEHVRKGLESIFKFSMHFTYGKDWVDYYVEEEESKNKRKQYDKEKFYIQHNLINQKYCNVGTKSKNVVVNEIKIDNEDLKKIKYKIGFETRDKVKDKHLGSKNFKIKIEDISYEEIICILSIAKDYDIYTVLFNSMQEMYCNNNKDKSVNAGFKNSKEMKKAFEEYIQDPKRFQENAYHWSETKKRQYFIFLIIIQFIWGNFIQPYFQENIGVPVMAWTVAHIKELPEKASEFVTDLKNEIEATIIENVPYYYKVAFVDENGVYREGYVSKRSVKLIETTDEEEIEE